MTGRLIDLSVGLNGKQRVTIELNCDFREQFERLKDTELEVDIRKRRKRRSLNANAYFHLLVGEIAEAEDNGEDQVKIRLVLNYGTRTRREDGSVVGFKLPVDVDVNQIYKYVKCFDTREENGVLFNCYIVYKHTSNMDSKEMARLIDGTISVARELGIETDTPEQLARYKDRWDK